ncbi:hypothetical protein SAMN05443248_4948 [Bradyrhizobium erythrophlei]|uniref:Uncharacterized protein n=1 Tax=Bradyrhizobium erythrophlei TaxID=1437360 RepID=A0A1M5TC63_9BRAD|nr:hypothetical protein SAMN05443248_4948 [Bradyrhizobium erythrophlei]
MGAFQWGLTIKLKLFAVLSALVFFFTANLIAQATTYRTPPLR